MSSHAVTPPPDENDLYQAALRHLARYGVTEAGLRRVLERRIDRWLRAQSGAGATPTTAAPEAFERDAREDIERDGREDIEPDAQDIIERDAREIFQQEAPEDIEQTAREAIERDALEDIERTAREAIGRVISRLTAAGALSDSAFAESRARTLTRGGQSNRAVRARLIAKGVAPELALAAAAGDADSELAAALVLVRKRRIGAYRVTAEVDTAVRMKEMALLARAGFSRHVAEQALSVPREEAEQRIFDLRR